MTSNVTDKPGTPGVGAALLRRAAETLRAHALRTDEDPADVAWDVSSTGLHMNGSADYRLRARRNAPPTLWGGTARGGIPEYVALMHPPVALALAAVLDNVADGFASQFPDLVAPEVYALARAVLREGES